MSAFGVYCMVANETSIDDWSHDSSSSSLAWFANAEVTNFLAVGFYLGKYLWFLSCFFV